MAQVDGLKTPQYDKSLLASCGEDTFIHAWVDIRRPSLVKVGSHTAIDSFVVISTRATIGHYVHIPPHCTIIGGADAHFDMRDFCTLAAGCRIIVRSDGYMGAGLVGPTIPAEYADELIGTQTVMERFVNLATNVTVYPNVRLAEGTIAKAGSVITKDTEPWSVYAGVPAKKIGERPGRERLQASAQELYRQLGSRGGLNNEPT